jgi:predicted transposase YbfD/YdcC
VSADAMGCQKTIAQAIVNGGADYVLAHCLQVKLFDGLSRENLNE